MEGDISLNIVEEFLTLVDMQGSQAQFTVHLPGHFIFTVFYMLPFLL